MACLTPEAFEHFESHHGIASIVQLGQLGVNRNRVRTLQHDGVLELVLHGAYRLAGTPLTELARCVAVCVAHPGHAIAGPTAGRIWGLRRLPSDKRVHTLSPPHSQPTKASWVVPFRTAAVHPGDLICRGDGIVLTSRARTAMDLARFLPACDVLSVIEQVMKDGRLTDDDMRRVGVDWMSPRRKWVRTFLEQLDRRLSGGAAESHYEMVLGDALQQAGVRGLKRQHWLDLPSYGPARLDLAIPKLRWAIEVDIFPTHLEAAGREADRRRDDACQAIGWGVTRLDQARFGDALPATVESLLQEFHQRCSGEM